MIVLTASGVVQYTLLGYLDPSPGSPVDQMMYQDYPLQNCAIHKLMFGQSNIDNGLGQAEVSGPRIRELRVGDSGMQYFCKSIPWVNDHRRSYGFNEYCSNNNEISHSESQHFFSSKSYLRNLLLARYRSKHYIIAVSQIRELRDTSFHGHEQSFFMVDWLRWFSSTPFSLNIDTGNMEGAHNSPANGSWTFLFQFTKKNSTTPQILHIAYLATGELDHANTKDTDLATANAILKPLTDPLKLLALTTGMDLDIWRILNFIWVGIYWSVLLDLGQISPVTYSQQPTQAFYTDDFSQIRSYAPTNNIFYNDTLFTIYSTYLLKTFVPLMNATVPAAGFAPLTETNRINATETSFKRSYTCTVRRWKAPLTAVVSILVAQYTLIRVGYSIIMFVATWYQKRKIVEGLFRLI